MSLRTCEAKDCTDHAAVSYVWPGRGRLFACVTHWLKVCSTTGALGMPIESLDARRFIDHPKEFMTP